MLSGLRTARLGMLIPLICVGSLCAEDAAGEPLKAVEAKVASVDFPRDVQVIFRKHCISCHGASDHRNGLRLDTVTGARSGGGTGRPILGGTLETNEIYRRISSTDPTFRMPKGSEPLSDTEIESIRQWVVMGCTWPDEEPLRTSQKPDVDSSWPLWRVLPLIEAAAAADIWLNRNPYYPLFRWIVPLALVLTLIIEQFRKRAKRVPPSTRCGKYLSSITNKQILIAWGMAAGFFVLLQMRGHRDEALQEVAKLKELVSTASATASVGGGALTPNRLTHPKSLERTYYRGNCERSDSLFNGGNYCTATFLISLRTASGVPLEYRQPVPEEELVVHFELHRAPGATRELYATDMLSDVFLLESPGPTNPENAGTRGISLRTLNPEWQWGCDVPVTQNVSDEGWRSGWVYVHKGKMGEAATAPVHYCIKYEIHIRDGRIEPDSDLWMACLLINPTVQPPPSNGQIPFCEWFDWRPIPEITGPNSTDPKHLGIPEHRPESKQVSGLDAVPEPVKPEKSNPD